MDIEIVPAREIVDDAGDLAPVLNSTGGPDGGHVPGGLAGYTFDGAAYCPVCAQEIEVMDTETGETYTLHEAPHGRTYDDTGTTVGLIESWDEWDYPGATCHVCHDTLRTNVIVYEVEVLD